MPTSAKTSGLLVFLVALLTNLYQGSAIIEKTDENTVEKDRKTYLLPSTIEDIVVEPLPDIQEPDFESFTQIPETVEETLSFPLYTGEVTICGESIDILTEFYLGLIPEFKGEYFFMPHCGTVPVQEDWVINEVPFVKRKDFNYDISNYGCGPIAFYMGLEGIGFDTTDYDVEELYSLLGTNEKGTPFTQMVDLAKELDVYGGEYEDMTFSQIEHEIMQGNTLLLTVNMSDYQEVTNCLGKCPRMGHNVTVTGVDPLTETIFINDAYFSEGIHVAIPWDVMQQIYHNSDSKDPNSEFRYGRILVLERK